MHQNRLRRSLTPFLGLDARGRVLETEMRDPCGIETHRRVRQRNPMGRGR